MKHYVAFSRETKKFLWQATGPVGATDGIILVILDHPLEDSNYVIEEAPDTVHKWKLVRVPACEEQLKTKMEQRRRQLLLGVNNRIEILTDAIAAGVKTTGIDKDLEALKKYRAEVAFSTATTAEGLNAIVYPTLVGEYNF